MASILLKEKVTIRLEDLIDMDREEFLDYLDFQFNVPVGVNGIEFTPVKISKGGTLTLNVTGTVDETELEEALKEQSH